MSHVSSLQKELRLGKLKAMPFLLFSLFIIFLTSCSTLEMSEEIYEPEKGGVVHFSDRAEALVLAQKFCRGPVKVVAEGNELMPTPKSSEKTSAGASGAVANIKVQVRSDNSAETGYLQFRCAIQGKKN